MPVPLVLDLVASVLAGGATPTGAVRAVGESLRASGDVSGERLLAMAADGSGGFSAGVAAGLLGDGMGDGKGVGRAEPGLSALRQALQLAVATGLGPVGFVRTAAEEGRRRRASAQARSARRLGVLVVLPTGLCLLPAFILLTVVPLVLDLVLG